MIAPHYTILIVDDSAEDRETYHRYLSREIVSEYELVEAESGEEGLEQLSLIQPDLILLDYLLTDFDGLEFIAEFIKNLKIFLSNFLKLQKCDRISRASRDAFEKSCNVSHKHKANRLK